MPPAIPALSLLVFLPLAVLPLVLLLPRPWLGAARWLALLTALAQLLIVTLYLGADCCPVPGASGAYDGIGALPFAFSESRNWIDLSLGSLGHLRIQYLLGLDGLSFLMVLLTPIVMAIAAVASWRVQEGRRGYFALLLLLNTALLGCFLALDFFLFYVFYEFMLLPMYFLIGIWGGERRQYAALKFFLYTLAGSVLMLLAVLALHLSYIDPAATAFQLGLAADAASATPDAIRQVQQLLADGQLPAAQQVHGFNLLNFSTPANLIPGSLLADPSWRTAAFVLLFVAFAVKLPLVPLHTWLPDAHVEASTPISVVLAGVLLKVGGYGILRICYPIFPDVAVVLAPTLCVLAVIAIIYGALLALAQQDLKRLVAYSSVSHMGYVLLGISALDPTAWNGAVLQLFVHGLTSALLFLLVGVLYDRVHDRQIASFRGLWTRMPHYTVYMLFGCFAGLGLPGLASFVPEFLVFLGAFTGATKTGIIPFGWVAAGLAGIFLSAVYLLYAFQRMFFGTYAVAGGPAWTDKLRDITWREHLMLTPLVVLIVWFGIWPNSLLQFVEGWAGNAVQQLWLTIGGRP